MGVDRHLVATQNIQKGEYIASLYRAHNYTEPKGKFGLALDLVMLIINRKADAEGLDMFFDECAKRGACELIDTIVEDGCVKVVDE